MLIEPRDKGCHSETGTEEQLGERRHHVASGRAESACLPQFQPSYLAFCSLFNLFSALKKRFLPVLALPCCGNYRHQLLSRQWLFWSANKPPRRSPTAQVRSIVGVSSTCQSTATGECSSLMSTMAMASHSRRVSLLSCCLRGEVEKLRSKGSRRATKRRMKSREEHKHPL